MRNNFFALSFFVLTLLVSSCSSDDDSKTEVKAGFDVTMPVEFKSTIYPSLIFGLTEIEKEINEPVDYFTIKINTNIKSDVQIVIQESKLNYETVINQKDIKGAHEFTPSIKWKFDDLQNMTQPGNTDITFVCYEYGTNKELGRKNLRLSYRSINECVLYLNMNDEIIPLPFLMAAYINEDSPIVDAFLKDVLSDNPALSGFVGYQQDKDKVDMQVYAIFNTLRNKGIKYSSITETSNSNPNVISQYIRFSDEVLNNTQANCADGTAFFCSVLKKIGIHTAMIFEPGHVYLGYYLDDSKNSLRLLETTVIGTKEYSFIDALNLNIEKFNSNLEQYNNEEILDGYFLIDIDDAREIIKPIGR